MSDFHTLTCKHETAMAIKVLHTGYCLCILLYMLDELFCIFKKLKTDDFNIQCMVTWEILHITLCHSV